MLARHYGRGAAMYTKPTCNGQGARGADGTLDHCCYQGGVACPHLRENAAGRRYACALMVKYGSWEAMAESPEYRPVGEHWVSVSKPFTYCQDFDPAFCCRPEHRAGRHNENCPPGCAMVVV